MTSGNATGNIPVSGQLILALFLLVATLFTLSLPHRELYGEEGRRVMAAREMLSSGDFILPTVSGEPYLNKPPLYPWMTAMIGFVKGEVDAIAVRIPALVATLLTGALLFWTGVRLGLRRAGALACFFFLLCPMVMRKASLGETDLLLTLGCTIYALEMLVLLRPGSTVSVRTSMFWMVVGLCIAFLSKGPAAVPFVIGLMMAVVCTRKVGHWRRPHWWGPPLLALAISSLWFIAVFQRPEGAIALGTWSDELTRMGSSQEWWQHRWEFILGVLFGFFPVTLVLILKGYRGLKEMWRADPLLRGLIIATGIPALFYLLWPGVQPRYLLPALPMICLMTARILDVDFEMAAKENRGVQLVSRFLQVVIAGAGLFALSVGISRAIDPQIWPAIPVAQPIAWIWMALILFAGAFFPITDTGKGFPGSSWTRLMLLLLAWAGLHCVVLMPIRGQQRPGENLARSIEALVPEGRTLWHDLPANWNTLGQVNREFLLLTAERKPAAGDWILTIHPESEDVGDVVAVMKLLDGSRATLGVISSGLPEEK